MSTFPHVRKNETVLNATVTHLNNERRSLPSLSNSNMKSSKKKQKKNFLKTRRLSIKLRIHFHEHKRKCFYRKVQTGVVKFGILK